MKPALAVGLLLASQGAVAQVAYPPNVTQDDVNAAIVAATPPDCPAPLSDSLTATAGVQVRCMPRPDAQRATQVQATSVVTASDGTFTGNWPVPFLSVPAGYFADILVNSTSSAPYKCSFISVSASAFSGKCWQIVPTTLPSTVTAVIGLTVSPLANAAAGLTVRVVGRQ